MSIVRYYAYNSFQFLGIPPKGERGNIKHLLQLFQVSNF